MGYSKKEILNELNNDINNIKLLYTKKYINYSGKTIDTKELYSELISEYILKNRTKLDEIEKITRSKSYKTDSHTVMSPEEKNELFNVVRGEEHFARFLLGRKFASLGEIIDYQVPIKNSQKDTKAGKIDLLSYNKLENILFLIELKREYNKETLLRCILEIYTYFKQIDRDKLKTSFSIHENVSVKPAILIFEDSKQYEESTNKYFLKTRKLASKLGIDIFVLNIQKMII